MTNNTSTPAHITNIYGDIYCPISQVAVAPNRRDGVTACACCGTLIEEILCHAENTDLGYGPCVRPQGHTRRHLDGEGNSFED